MDKLVIGKVTSDLSSRFRFFSFLAAILVVFIHVPAGGIAQYNQWLIDLLPVGICSVAVPFFFFAAGYFGVSHIDEKGWWKSAVCKRCLSLGVPYVIWGLLYSVVLCAAARFDSSIRMADVMNPLNALGLVPWEQPTLKLLWFLRSLFVCVIFSPVLIKIVQAPYALGLVLLGLVNIFGISALWSLGTPEKVVGLFTYGVFSIKGIFYFCLGMFFRLNPKIVDSMNLMRWVFLFLGMICLVYCTICHGATPAIKGLLTLSLMLGCAFAVLGDVVRGTMLQYSFPLYLVHRFVMLPLRFGLMKLSGSATPTSLFWYFTFALMTIGISVLVISCMKRCLPRFSSIAFGGR